MSELFFKVLGKNGNCYHGGKGSWHLPKGKRPGKWMPKILEVIPCKSGYHLCRPKDLTRWLGTEIWLAEGRGTRIDQNDKTVWQQARLIKKLPWDPVKFAIACAERVLPIFEAKYPKDNRPRLAIEAAKSGDKNAAAYAAANADNAAYAAANADNAAYAAANAAYAAYAAYAADNAAYAAAYADNAANAAAYAANAEKEWQTEFLMKMLLGEKTID